MWITVLFELGSFAYSWINPNSCGSVNVSAFKLLVGVGPPVFSGSTLVNPEGTLAAQDSPTNKSPAAELNKSMKADNIKKGREVNKLNLTFFGLIILKFDVLDLASNMEVAPLLLKYITKLA